MKILITGGCGFLGSNIAEEALTKNVQLTILDNLSRSGSQSNLEWLKSKGHFVHINADIRNVDVVTDTIKTLQPDVIYHLAGQVAMTTSIADPRADCEINVLGTLNVLEAVRQYSPQSIVVYSSTNKVYGDLEYVTYHETDTRYVADEYKNGFDESTTLDFHSPYGVSKGSADQYCLDYARIFGLRTIVFRHSSMYGGRQFSTYDQGWVGWFCAQGLLQKNDVQAKPFTISGNGKQVRDVLFSTDMVRLYLAIPQYIDEAKGQAFNIGGGMQNSLSLLELFALIESILDIKMRYTQLETRISDQKIFVADLKKISGITGWEPQYSAEAGIKYTLDWLKNTNA